MNSHSVKKFLKTYFPGLVALRNKWVNQNAASRFRAKPMETVFNDIFESNYWTDAHSRSGTGSNEQQTTHVRHILTDVIKDRHLKSMLDIPCGDFFWMKNVAFDECSYVGADIVQKIVDSNTVNYARPNVRFIHADVTKTELGPYDLIFCRDCLVHFSYDAVFEAFKNLKRSGSQLILTTTFPNHTNRNITTGDWRPLNLQLPPFSLPGPIAIFDEKCTEGNGMYADKSLGLWHVKDLPVF
jgi:2-polyprenyl-3-methyl-5-hydroxy-6-metoxy-1,4-benzoquinol methylase